MPIDTYAICNDDFSVIVTVCRGPCALSIYNMRFVKIIEAFYTRAEFWDGIQSQLSLLLSDRSKIGLRVNR